MCPGIPYVFIVSIEIYSDEFKDCCATGVFLITLFAGLSGAAKVDLSPESCSI